MLQILETKAIRNERSVFGRLETGELATKCNARILNHEMILLGHYV